MCYYRKFGVFNSDCNLFTKINLFLNIFTGKLRKLAFIAIPWQWVLHESKISRRQHVDCYNKQTLLVRWWGYSSNREFILLIMVVEVRNLRNSIEEAVEVEISFRKHQFEKQRYKRYHQTFYLKPFQTLDLTTNTWKIREKWHFSGRLNYKICMFLFQLVLAAPGYFRLFKKFHIAPFQTHLFYILCKPTEMLIDSEKKSEIRKLKFL